MELPDLKITWRLPGADRKGSLASTTEKTLALVSLGAISSTVGVG